MRAGRPRARAALLGLFFLLLAICFAGLGTWQVERRAWKLDLIARTERRLAANPVAAPAPRQWLGLTREQDEYRRVRVTGAFVSGRDTRVTALTVLGAGYWLLTPFRDARGFIVLVNRGFVPSHVPLPVPDDRSVTGLLRFTERDGTLLSSNVPHADRWYSRDVAAIARRRGLGPVAPYFIDAVRSAGSPLYPHGGLTVVSFPNHHAIYALTWFALMILSLGAAYVTIRTKRADAPGKELTV